MAEKRLLRRRKLIPKADDQQTLVAHVLDQVTSAESERTVWMSQMFTRYAKFRGWLEEFGPKTYPWSNASNQHLPLMMSQSLRVKAGLYNAVLGMRPVMQAKPAPALAQKGKVAAERVQDLIDYQVFTEGDGEDRIEKYIDGFVDWGTALAFVHWARDRRHLVDVRVRPQPEEPLIEAMAVLLPQEFPGATNVIAENADGTHWTLTLPDGDTTTEVDVRVYDRDEESLELVVAWEQTVFDGPSMTVHALEDIVVPMRCENAQPPSAENPFGAPWIARLVKVDIDTIRRRQRDGTYDYLPAEAVEEDGEIEAAAQPAVPTDPTASAQDALKGAKDQHEGRQAGWGDSTKEFLTAVEWYGRRDVNGDGLAEDVIVTILRETEQLCRVKYLTEQYPGTPPRRPFGEARYIPVPGQFYGIGMLELMEGMHDMLHVTLNQAIDGGTLANSPFGFYRASSGIKAEVTRPEPGELLPVDNPQTDVVFPQLPHADQSFHFNMFSLGKQLMEETTQIGPLQRGQVPTGKASAVRTAATTMAILQQGAAMPEQVLRRLFRGLAMIWSTIHVLNTRYLPKRKAYLVAGKPLDQDDAYATINDPSDIDVPVAFDFQATLLNTNKGLVSQALQSLGAALVNPLTMQLKLVGPEQLYNFLHDLIQAGSLDPGRYVARPAGMPEGPRMLAEEAIGMLMNGRMPEYAPLEEPTEHYKKLTEFAGSDALGMLRGGTELLFKEYLQQALRGVMQAQRQQMMMQAAQQFAAAMGNQGQGAQSVMGGEVPAMQATAPDQREVMGAMNGGGA